MSVPAEIAVSHNNSIVYVRNHYSTAVLWRHRKLPCASDNAIRSSCRREKHACGKWKRYRRRDGKSTGAPFVKKTENGIQLPISEFAVQVSQSGPSCDSEREVGSDHRPCCCNSCVLVPRIALASSENCRQDVGTSKGESRSRKQPPLREMVTMGPKRKRIFVRPRGNEFVLAVGPRRESGRASEEVTGCRRRMSYELSFLAYERLAVGDDTAFPRGRRSGGGSCRTSGRRYTGRS